MKSPDIDLTFKEICITSAKRGIANYFEFFVILWRQVSRLFRR